MSGFIDGTSELWTLELLGRALHVSGYRNRLELIQQGIYSALSQGVAAAEIQVHIAEVFETWEREEMEEAVIATAQESDDE